MKRMISILLAFILLLTMFVTVSAAEVAPGPGDPLVPEYTYISNVSATLTASGSTLTVKLYCKGVVGTTSISATFYLQRWNGSSWVSAPFGSASAVSATASGREMNRTFTATVSSGTYRIKAVFKVYCNGSSETATVYSNTVTV